MKRILSLIMVLAMICAFIPANVFAATGKTTTGTFGYLNYELTDGEITITGLEGSVSSVEIPDEIKENPVIAIADYAFDSNAVIEEISFGSNLKRIGNYAFSNVSIEKLRLPSGIEELGNSAFGNTAIEEVYIPKSLENCDYAPFDGCSILTKVVFEDGITTIPKRIFENTGLRSIEIPSTVTSIGESAFSQCSLLKDVTFNDGLKTIGGWAFYKDPIEEVSLPKTLTTLGNSAFAENIALKTVNLTKSIETCDFAPFDGCKNLRTVSFEEGITKIPENIFENTGLRSIEIPSTVTSIGESAFSQCSLLKDVTFNDGLKTIGGWAFYKDPIEEVSLPKTLTTLGNSAFADNVVMKSIYLPKSLKDCGFEPFGRSDNLRTVEFEKGIKKIPAGVFTNSGLRSITIPDSVTNIEEYAFSNCESLLSVNLNKQLETIGSGAFQGDISLESIFIPKSLEKSGGYVFDGCSKLTAVEFEEGITTIVTGILSGTSIESIAIPNTVKTIEVDAFSYCDNLKTVYIPSSVTEIEWDILWESNNAVIVAEPNSNAVLYAVDNNKPFMIDGQFKDDDSYVLDRQLTNCFADVDHVSINGYYNLYVNYGIKDKWASKTTDKKIVLRLPNNVASEEDYEIVVRVDGKKIDNYEYDGYDRALIVPVEKTKGDIRISLKAASQGMISSVAFLEAKKNGNDIRELIGITNEEADILTMEAPDTISNNSFEISGLAPASKQISIKVNGVDYKTVTSSKAGRWSSNVDISDPKNYKSYLVTVGCKDIYGENIKEKNIVYKEGEPKLTSFVMQYNEHDIIKSVNLLDPESAKEIIYFVPGTQFDFIMKFENIEKLGKVYVSSMRNGQKKYLEAKYDKSKDAYVTDGFFDENDHNYVIGKISCECSVAEQEIVYGENEPILSILSDQKGALASAATSMLNTETKNHTVLDLGKLTSELSGYKLNYNAEVYEGTSDDVNEWMAIDTSTCAKTTMKDKAGNNVDVFLDYSNPKEQKLVVHELSTNEYTKYTATLDGSDDYKSLSDISSVLKANVSGIYDACDMLLNYYGGKQDYSNYDQMILSNFGSVDPDSPLYPTYITLKEKAGIIMRASSAALFINYLGWSAMELTNYSLFGKTVYGLSSILGLYVAGRDYILNFAKEAAKNGFDMLSDFLKNMFTANPNMAVDPSGYVYDSQSKECLEGVSVTAYYIPNDDSPDFWKNKPADSEYGSLWDAHEYDQNNPLLTNADGFYAWDVPEGWWRVKYEKDGYETTWSNWMTVPPIQTEVNIGMESSGSTHGLLGDVNGDGLVNSYDLTALAKHVAKIALITDKQLLQNADTTKDGTVTADDLTNLAKYVARIIPSL